MSRLTASTPVLLVADVVAAARYYTDKLGFKYERFWGEPPMFTIVWRDGFAVMLNQVKAGDAIHPNAGYDGRYDIYFDVDDADALHAEFTAKGADVVCAPEDQVYLMREFSLRDADGHLLAFGHNIAPK